MWRRAAIFGLALGLAGCGGAAGNTTTSRSTTPGPSTPAAARWPADSRVLVHPRQPLSQAYAGRGSVYLSYTRPYGEHVGGT